ncbi:TPA: hypothetical protein SLO30_002901 [Morganella morganii]|nr:hypothetical protein [Morganella morganii]HEJ0265740.1 hypothetical protein [Morganella morganii]
MSIVLTIKKPADTEHQPAYGCVLSYCEALLNILDLNIDFIVIFFNNQRVDNN